MKSKEMLDISIENSMSEYNEILDIIKKVSERGDTSYRTVFPLKGGTIFMLLKDGFIVNNLEGEYKPPYDKLCDIHW